MKNPIRCAVGALAVAAAAVLLSVGFAGGFAVAQYNTLNYMEQGGAAWDVGGALKFRPGGYLVSDKATATANSGDSYAVTANAMSGVITTDSLTTAAGSSRSITINDSEVTASSVVQTQWAGGTDTAGTPIIKAVPGAGTITLTLQNNHASAAFNGTFIVNFNVD
jgi:hypothetical protein